MPKFSVIIPVYNVAPYLRECLDSVCVAAEKVKEQGDGEQRTGSPLVEVICVDDGSTDGSGEILDEYVARFNSSTFQPFNFLTFRAIHQKNAGVSAARNAALDVARGEWILFLDADDVWSDNLLERVVSVVKRTNCDVVKFGLARFTDAKALVWNGVGDDRVEVEDIRRFVSAQILSGWLWQRAYRRSLIRQLRFPRYRIGEDMSFMVQVILRANSCAVVTDRLYGYRCRPGSASQIRKDCRDVGYSIAYLRDVFEAFESSGRHIASATLRSFSNAATELVANEITRLPVTEREGAFREAQASWRRLAELRVFPQGQKFRLRLARIFPFWWVAFILFCVPYRLKLKGLHRS